jgi:hypothetical protein
MASVLIFVGAVITMLGGSLMHRPWPRIVRWAVPSTVAGVGVYFSHAGLVLHQGYALPQTAGAYMVLGLFAGFLLGAVCVACMLGLERRRQLDRFLQED